MARMKDRWYKLSEIPETGVMKAAFSVSQGDLVLFEDEDSFTVLSCVYEVNGHHAEFEIRLDKERELVYLVPKDERYASVLSHAFSRAMRGK